MSLVVGTNTSAHFAQDALRANQRKTATAMERLSTGLRINSARDDAAGLAISQSMTSQIRGLNQAVRNINEGINLLQTAEGGLGSITDMLQRMRELAVQSANGTNSDAQRAYLQKEAAALQEQIGKVVDTTTWNDKKLLDGSFSGQKIQVGDDIGTTMDLSIANPFQAAAQVSTTEPEKAWTKLLGTSSDASAMALTTGLDGSIYVSGYTYGALDGQTNSGSYDAFLTKYSADGTKAWTKMRGTSSDDHARSLTTGLDGSIYVSGYTYGALDGQTNSGSSDAFLTKYSADGTKAWTKLLGTSGDDAALALTTGLDGSIYVSGYTGGALDGQTYSGAWDAFLTKYSADGTKVWTKQLGTSDSEAAVALTTGLDGSIYVSGYTYGAVDGQTNSGGVDTYLTKYSVDGTKAWTKMMGTSGSEWALALTTGLDGSIYVSGCTFGALDGQTNSGSSDAFLTKYSADGTKAWTKLLGTSDDDYAYALTTGLDGSIYVSGYANGALDGQTYSGYGDVFLTKYSAHGTKAWTKLLGTSSGDFAMALTTGLDGSIYVSGATGGALDGQTYSGSYDAFLTKYVVPSSSFSVDISNQSGANSAIGVIDSTLDSVNSTRSTIGSYINRLSYAVDNATNISSNLSASRSTIMDADYAEESANLAKTQIIQQAATAMLAQANQQPQAVLALLKNI